MQKFKKKAKQWPREVKEVCPQLLGYVFGWDMAGESETTWKSKGPQVRSWRSSLGLQAVAAGGACVLSFRYAQGPRASPENLGLVAAWQQAHLSPQPAGQGPFSGTSSGGVPAEAPFVSWLRPQAESHSGAARSVSSVTR